MSLQQRLDAFKTEFKSGKAPYFAAPETHLVMERATAELVASGQARRALKAGDMAPDFTLNDPDGMLVSSVELLKQGPLVITFYRGGWCQYCNLELQGLEATMRAFRELGANLIAISPQNAVNSRKSVRSNNLTYPILSDPRNDLAEVFGIRFVLPDYLVDLYKKLNNDLPAFNGDDSWTLPMPARYVVNQDGTILYSEVNPDYTHRPEPEDMLPVLRQCAVTAGRAA
jgi:peroxiredoxin